MKAVLFIILGLFLFTIYSIISIASKADDEAEEYWRKRHEEDSEADSIKTNKEKERCQNEQKY